MKKHLHLAVKNRYTMTLDDDPMVPKLIEQITGIPTLSFDSADTLLEAIKHKRPLAIFVDVHLGLHSVSGLQLIPTLRSGLPYCPIIVITSDPSSNVLVEALSLGADDFVKKPIEPAELQSRLQARVKDQVQKQESSVIRCADISIDSAHRRLRGNGTEVYLSPIAMSILIALVEANGTVISRDALKQRAWGRLAVTDNAIDRRIHEIRQALTQVSRSLEIDAQYGSGFILTTRSKAVSAAAK